MSQHDLPIVPNLTRGLKPTGLDQIWVADITYVRLAEAFVYLAVDPRRLFAQGHRLGARRSSRGQPGDRALDMALAARDPAPISLIHHSDRGVQYASNLYVERLESRGVAISMSRPANPYDNAKAESFMKTLKSRGGQRQDLPRSRRRRPPDRRLHRNRLQRQAPALGAGLQTAGRVRSRNPPG